MDFQCEEPHLKIKIFKLTEKIEDAEKSLLEIALHLVGSIGDFQIDIFKLAHTSGDVEKSPLEIASQCY